jgi:hypothetical protein
MLKCYNDADSPDDALQMVLTDDKTPSYTMQSPAKKQQAAARAAATAVPVPHLAGSDCLHHDGHEGVVGTTQLRALAIEDTWALDGHPHLPHASQLQQQHIAGQQKRLQLLFTGQAYLTSDCKHCKLSTASSALPAQHCHSRQTTDRPLIRDNSMK